MAALGRVTAVAALSGVLVWGALAWPGLAAEPTAVRSGHHPGFGRLVLDWSAPVTVTTEPRGEWVLLTFDHPFEADLTPVLEDLEDYLLGFAPGESRRQLLLLLAPSVRPNVFAFDSHVVVDFYPVTGARPLLPVRTGRHGEIDRIVFDWPESVGFRLSQARGRITLEFDRSVRIDSNAIVDALAPRVLDAWVEADGRRSRLHLRLPAGVAVEAYRQAEDERRILLDLQPAAPAAPPTFEAEPLGAAAAAPNTS
jgi:hypothetical protein